MNVIKTSLEGVLILEPKVFSDDRGFFLETYRKHDYDAIGLPSFVQSNHSRSKKGVLRGLHYQLQRPQAKLVRVTRGCVLDVAVDVRFGSETFGQYETCLLDDSSHRQFFVPEGFAHGFLVLSKEVDFEYLCSDYYHFESEQSILWNDPDIGIDWGDVKDVVLSEKDKNATRLFRKSHDKLPLYKKVDRV